MTKCAIITGCNGGIGECLAAAFSKAGWRVIGIDKTGAQTNHATAVIKEDIGRFAAESGRLKNVGREIRKLSQDLPIKVLINNAAVQHLGHLSDLDPARISETMNVNLIAPMLLAKEFLPELTTHNGSIINIGSVHAQATKPGFSAYATSKTGLHGLTRALAVDLGPNVRVNTIAPAATATKMLEAGFAENQAAYNALKQVHPMQRIAEPEEIARIALFLASEDATFLTGATVYADGGILSRLHDPA